MRPATAVLDEFRRSSAARACADPQRAYANCLALSALCAQRLRAAGVACGLLHLAGSRDSLTNAAGRWPYCDPAGLQHWTVAVGAWSIDWTARQFAAAAAWPDVRPIEELTASWGVVEPWACERCEPLVAHRLHLELAPAWLESAHRAIARASAGRGPFPDPRHDTTPPLVKPCACAAGAAIVAAG